MAKLDVYTVDTGVPIPPERKSTLGQYPINTLEVGESILFPRIDRDRVQVSASALKKRTGKTFTVRVMDKDNCRVWRTK